MNAYNVYKHGNNCASVKMSQTIIEVIVKTLLEFNIENSKDTQKRPDFRTAIY